MKISIISASQRSNSQSRRVAMILKNFILNYDNKVNCYNLDMYEKKFHFGVQKKLIILNFGKLNMIKFAKN